MKVPFVFINMAMTADGKIATANRAVSTFSSPRDFEHLARGCRSRFQSFNGMRQIVFGAGERCQVPDAVERSGFGDWPRHVHFFESKAEIRGQVLDILAGARDQVIQPDDLVPVLE